MGKRTKQHGILIDLSTPALSGELEATRETVREQICSRTVERMLSLSNASDCMLSRGVSTYREASAHTHFRVSSPSGHNHDEKSDSHRARPLVAARLTRARKAITFLTKLVRWLAATSNDPPVARVRGTLTPQQIEMISTRIEVMADLGALNAALGSLFAKHG